MAIPEVIRVSREGGNFSSCMGDYDLQCGDEANQFWGRVVSCFPQPPDPQPANWHPEKRCYAVLHRFDAWGHHLGTEHRFAGVSTPRGESEVLLRAGALLDEMVGALGEVEYADIEIRRFQVEIDHCLFGLVDVSQPEAGPAFAEQVAMEPGNLLFRPPWNGRYSS